MADPDLAVLPEWRENGAGEVLRRGAEGAGYLVHIASRRAGLHCNGLAVWTKGPSTAQRITPPEATRGELLLVTFEGV